MSARVSEVLARVAAAARHAGRDPESVRVIAATKTRSVQEIAVVMRAGVRELGENRAQELVAKAPHLATQSPTWHFIGRLQRNKVNPLIPWVTWWHSIDRVELAAAIAARVAGAKVLLEVNVAAEPQKGGVAPAGLPALVDRCRDLGLEVCGLMTVAPASGDPRPTFAGLRELARGLELVELSMGMSGDYEFAVAEGATMVRLGTALFGPRPTFRESGPPGP